MLVEVDGPSWLTASILAGNAASSLRCPAPWCDGWTGAAHPQHRRACGALVRLGVADGRARPGRSGCRVALLVGATVLFTSAELIHAPVSMALAASAAPGPYRGRYLAAFQYSFTAASIAAPAFFAVTFAFDPAAPWLLLAGAMALSVPGVLSLERRLPAASVRPTLVRSGA